VGLSPPSILSRHRTGSTFLRVKVTAMREVGRRGGTEGGRRKHLENRTWLLPSAPNYTLSLLLPSLVLSPFSPPPSLPLSFFPFAFFSIFLLLLSISFPTTVLAMMNGSPVTHQARDCETTHSSLNHQPLDPQTSDQGLTPGVIMTLKSWHYISLHKLNCFSSFTIRKYYF